jgi:acetate kinase
VAIATGRDARDVIADLNRESGLLGLCGTSDMREVEARARTGDRAARLAIDVTVHRLVKYVGAYVAVLGGCDALVFTAGIGERSPSLRRAVCERLTVFGVVLDPARNERSDTIVSTDDSAIAVLVVPTDEERAIARQTAAVAAQPR